MLLDLYKSMIQIYIYFTIEGKYNSTYPNKF